MQRRVWPLLLHSHKGKPGSRAKQSCDGGEEHHQELGRACDSCDAFDRGRTDALRPKALAHGTSLDKREHSVVWPRGGYERGIDVLKFKDREGVTG